MISTMKWPVPGVFIAIAYFRIGGIPNFLKKFTTDQGRADNLIKQFQKEVLRKKVTAYLNHRGQIMDNFGGLKTVERAKVFEALRANFNALHDKSLESNCAFVNTNEDYLRLLLPGKSSRFYESTRESIEEILTFCKSVSK